MSPPRSTKAKAKPPSPEQANRPNGWLPIRKIVAAGLGALVSGTGVIAWIAGTGDLGWREVVAVVLAAVIPVATGYATPPRGGG